MKITRIYSDTQGDSHFEEIDIALEVAGEIENGETHDWTDMRIALRHNRLRRWFGA